MIAVYTIEEYKISFTALDADKTSKIPDPVTAKYNSSLADAIATVAVPTKTGHTGVWKIKNADDSTSDIGSTVVEGDITLIAVYKAYLSVNYTTSDSRTGTLKLNEGDNLMTAVEQLNTDLGITDTGIDLDDPYVWVTYNQDWKNVYSGATVKIDSTFVVDSYAFDKAQTYDPAELRINAASKYQISYTVGSNEGNFYLYYGDSLSDVGQSEYLNGLLSGTDYVGFVDNNGELFDSNTKADYYISSISPYKYKVTLKYSDRESYYYFGEGESFRSKNGYLPEPDYSSGYKGMWKCGDSIVNENTVITGDMVLTPFYIDENSTFTLNYYSVDDTLIYQCNGNVNTLVLNELFSNSSDDYSSFYWTVNGVQINNLTSVADLIKTGSETSFDIRANLP